MQYKIKANNFLTILLISIGFWLLITVLAASAYYVNFRDQYDGGWSNFFIRQFPIWGIWIFLSVALYFFVAYLRDKEYRLWHHLLAHLTLLVFTLVVIHFYLKIYHLILNGESITWQNILDREKPILIFYYFQNALVYLLVTGVIYGWFWNLSLQRAKVEKAQLNTKLIAARLQALSAQLHPHFLFNALNTIAALVRKQDNARAIQAIAEIGELLRISIQKNPQHKITLQEEVQFIANYLAIEQLRFPDQIDLIWEIEPQTERAKVPALILQPLVENALKHGINQREDNGKIWIKAARISDRLRLAIIDNGPGVHEVNHLPRDKGIGLINIQERLELLYKHDFSFEFNRNTETTVQIELPFEL